MAIWKLALAPLLNSYTHDKIFNLHLKIIKKLLIL